MIDVLEKEVELILSRIPSVTGKGEEATKQALVLPWLNALGYDIWNPSEVCPEFEADTAIKKAGQKEKVDLAIFREGIPTIFIEVKALHENLDGHHGQLKRYFNSTTTVVLGVVTNGIEYRFFTDSVESNIMDDEPFFVSRLNAIDSGLGIVVRFARKFFSAHAIRDFATELKFTAKIEKLLSEQLDLREKQPSESFVRWVLGEGIYSGRITANVVERFSPITKEALQRLQIKQIRRSIAKMEEGVSSAENYIPETNEETVGSPEDNQSNEPSEKKGIYTTNEELEAFAMIRQIAEESEILGQPIYDPSSRKNEVVDIGYRDTTGYFSVYVNKTSWWCIRLNFDAKQKWIGFAFEANEQDIPSEMPILPANSVASTRIQIDSVSDLAKVKKLILTSIKLIIDEKNMQNKT